MSSLAGDCSVHFSSDRSDWSTPQDFFEKLNKEFCFTLDVCAVAGNAKVSEFYSPQEDGLSKRWRGICWMNPPYGRQIGKWVHKARKEAYGGTVVVCLVPSRTDTNWWHEDVMKAAEVRLVRGRLCFDGHKNSAPFPSAIVVFKEVSDGPPIFTAIDRY